jgi:hypothetical protein
MWGASGAHLPKANSSIHIQAARYETPTISSLRSAIDEVRLFVG